MRKPWWWVVVAAVWTFVAGVAVKAMDWYADKHPADTERAIIAVRDYFDGKTVVTLTVGALLGTGFCLYALREWIRRLRPRPAAVPTESEQRLAVYNSAGYASDVSRRLVLRIADGAIWLDWGNPLVPGDVRLDFRIRFVNVSPIPITVLPDAVSVSVESAMFRFARHVKGRPTLEIPPGEFGEIAVQEGLQADEINALAGQRLVLHQLHEGRVKKGGRVVGERKAFYAKIVVSLRSGPSSAELHGGSLHTAAAIVGDFRRESLDVSK